MHIPMYIPGFSAKKIMRINPYISWTQSQLVSCTDKNKFNELVTTTFDSVGFDLLVNNIPSCYKYVYNSYGCSAASGKLNYIYQTLVTLDTMKTNATFIADDVPLPKKVKCSVYISTRYSYTGFMIFLYNKTKNILDYPCKIIRISNTNEVNNSYNWNPNYTGSQGNGAFKDLYMNDKTLIYNGFSNVFNYDIDVYNDCPNIMSQHTEGDLYYFGIADIGNTSGATTTSAVKPLYLTSLYIEF